MGGWGGYGQDQEKKSKRELKTCVHRRYFLTTDERDASILGWAWVVLSHV